MILGYLLISIDEYQKDRSNIRKANAMSPNPVSEREEWGRDSGALKSKVLVEQQANNLFLGNKSWYGTQSRKSQTG